MALYIKNGNFYSGKDLVKPEFGNAEQIACLKHYERLVEELNDKGHPLDFDYEEKCESSATFRCTCGTVMYIDSEGADAEECDDYVVGTIKKCRECLAVYEVDMNIDKELVIKIKKDNE